MGPNILLRYYSFIYKNGRHLGFWPLIYLVEKIWSLDRIHHAKLHLCPWFGEWVSNFVSEKRSANAIFQFHLRNCPPSWILTINIPCRERELIIRLNSACKVTFMSSVWWIYTQLCVRYWQNSKFMEKFLFKGVGVVNASTNVSITGSESQFL